VVVVIREVLLVQGQGDLEHFGARLPEFAFRNRREPGRG
jgi:hypothetical protein